MTIRKDTVFAVLRQAPEPLTFAGVMALLHPVSNSGESLATFAATEYDNLLQILAELHDEGKVEQISLQEYTYKVIE